MKATKMQKPNYIILQTPAHAPGKNRNKRARWATVSNALRLQDRQVAKRALPVGMFPHIVHELPAHEFGLREALCVIAALEFFIILDGFEAEACIFCGKEFLEQLLSPHIDAFI